MMGTGLYLETFLFIKLLLLNGADRGEINTTPRPLMLKKVDSSQLRVGMFIHDLDCGWMDHPFFRNRFAITSGDEIRKILASGIRSVTIDCTRGQDVADAPTVAEAAAVMEAEVAAIAAKPVPPLRTTLAEEFDRATVIRRQAAGLVKTVMQDARLGKAV